MSKWISFFFYSIVTITPEATATTHSGIPAAHKSDTWTDLEIRSCTVNHSKKLPADQNDCEGNNSFHILTRVTHYTGVTLVQALPDFPREGMVSHCGVQALSVGATQKACLYMHGQVRSDSSFIGLFRKRQKGGNDSHPGLDLASSSPGQQTEGSGHRFTKAAKGRPLCSLRSRGRVCFLV